MSTLFLRAVIQFSKNADELFVFDNASSNGTFLNKVDAARILPERVESNSMPRHCIRFLVFRRKSLPRNM